MWIYYVWFLLIAIGAGALGALPWAWKEYIREKRELEKLQAEE